MTRCYLLTRASACYGTDMNDSGRQTTDADRSGLRPYAVSVVEAARLAGCGKSLMWELVGTGEVPSFRHGRARRVRVADVEAYVDRKVREDREQRSVKASA